MLRVRPEVFTNNNPSNTILVTYSTARFWVCGFTNHADLKGNWSNPTIPYMTEVKGSAKCSPSPKMPSPCLHPSAIFAPCAVLSKCSRSYTIQRIKAFPSLSTCAFVWLFVSTHDRPPGLGREVILTFIPPMVNAFDSLMVVFVLACQDLFQI